MEWILENWTEILATLGAVLAAAAAIAKLTPSPKDDKFVAKILEYLNMVPKKK